MPKNKKPYIVVRKIGQEKFEDTMAQLMADGYLPIGGPTLIPTANPITGTVEAGFVQAVYLPRPGFNPC